MAELLRVHEDGAEQLVLVGDRELVLEAVAPVGVLGQLGHGAHVAALEELLRDVQALQLVHGLDLLLALGAGVVESLILLLDEVDLAFDFLLPLVLIVLLALLVFLLELSDFLQLGLFFDLENGLLHGFRQQDVEDGLNLTIVLKQVIIANLGHLVNARLLGHVFRAWRFRKEFICLDLDVVLLGLLTSLLGEEVGEVDLDARGRPRAQIVGLGLGFGFLEFEQLLFDHFDLLFLTLHLDTLLFLLRRRQVLVQVLQVVRVATEHSLVIHDVESLAVILLVIVVGVRVVGGRVLELLFLAHHFRLSTLERLSHNFKFINIEADMAF